MENKIKPMGVVFVINLDELHAETIVSLAAKMRFLEVSLEVDYPETAVNFEMVFSGDAPGIVCDTIFFDGEIENDDFDSEYNKVLDSVNFMVNACLTMKHSTMVVH